MLEDMYLPFKPRKMTWATIAKEKGLGPLADLIYLQHNITGTKKSNVAPAHPTAAELQGIVIKIKSISK